MAVRRDVVPVAASMLARSLVTGPIRQGYVVGAFASAVYAEVADDLLVLESSDAVGLPRALRVASPTSRRPFGDIAWGDLVQVGDGAVQVGPTVFRPARWYRPGRPRAATTYATPPALPALSDDVAAVCAVSRPLRPDGTADADVVRRLVGLGGGLTPEGDDLLAGLLVGLRADPCTTASADALAAVVIDRLPATTTLSAALLRDAAAGHGITALHALVRAGDVAARDRAVVRLLAVGHTSGVALAHGAVLAAAIRRPVQDLVA